jgi:hypothetical protein
MYMYMYGCVYVHAYVYVHKGEHMDAATALHGFIANSPAARDSMEKIITYLACRMADNACPVDVEALQGTVHDEREDKADLCQDEGRRLAAAALVCIYVLCVCVCV